MIAGFNPQSYDITLPVVKKIFFPVILYKQENICYYELDRWYTLEFLGEVIKKPKKS